RLQGQPAGAAGPGAGPAHRAGAGGAAPDRQRLHLQGGRCPPAHLGPDRRDPRLGGPAPAAALQPPRAEPLGRGPQPRLTGAHTLAGIPSSACDSGRRNDITETSKSGLLTLEAPSIWSDPDGARTRSVVI